MRLPPALTSHAPATSPHQPCACHQPAPAMLIPPAPRLPPHPIGKPLDLLPYTTATATNSAASSPFIASLGCLAVWLGNATGCCGAWFGNASGRQCCCWSSRVTSAVWRACCSSSCCLHPSQFPVVARTAVCAVLPLPCSLTSSAAAFVATDPAGRILAATLMAPAGVTRVALAGVALAAVAAGLTIFTAALFTAPASVTCVALPGVLLAAAAAGLTATLLTATALAGAAANARIPLPAETTGFTGELFTGALFTGALFTGALFTGALFTGALFTGALFTGALFTGALFTGALFTGALFTGALCRCCGCRCWSECC
ncbi:unnamed protein product [Closterium sp. NIES-54]